MEKLLKRSNRDPIQQEALILKQRLQQILVTLNNQKEQYDQIHAKQISYYKKQISSKNQTIRDLSQKLQNCKVELQLNQKQTQCFKQIIIQLKQEFFKMFKIVSKVDKKINGKKLQQKSSIKRVKSNLQERSKIKFQNQNSFVPSSPVKNLRIDINSYFMNVKSAVLIKSENFCKAQKGSSQTKNTEDKQLRDQISIKCGETTCFKDLLNNQLGINSKFQQAKSPIKQISTIQNTSLQKISILKKDFSQSCTRTFKENK